MVRLFALLLGSSRNINTLLLGLQSSLSLAQDLTIVGLPPLTEGRGIDLDNGALDQGLGAHQLVVAGIVDNVQNTGLAGAGLATPGKVAGVETEGALLDVATADADLVDALAAELGVAGLAAELGLSLLLGLCAFGTGVGALVTAVATNAYDNRG